MTKPIKKILFRLTKSDATFNSKNALLLSVIMGVILSALMLLASIRDNADVELSQMFLALILNVLLSFLIFSYGFAVIRSRIAVYWRYIITIVGAIAIAAVMSIIAFNLDLKIYGPDSMRYPMLISVFRCISAAVLAVFITLLLFFITRQHRMELENEHVRTENLLMKYDALEKQLDPHFMFNSLNTLSGLIGEDDTKAQNYLQQLASTYRYTMRQPGVVSLADELAFTNSYIYMMKIRYGDCLTVQQTIPEELLTFCVVPVSVQLLVENVLKHNVISERHPLCITIATTETGRLCVSNPLQLKTGTEQTSGVGLDNLGKRYELRFNEHILIMQTATTFSVAIPLINPMKARRLS